MKNPIIGGIKMLKPIRNHNFSAKKILTVVSILFIFITMNLYGNFVDIKTAEEVACNWYQHWVPYQIDSFNVKDVFIEEYNDHPSFYIFTFETNGFVIVSADDAAIPILGYSFISETKENITHPPLAEWMDNYHQQIDYIINQNIDNNETIGLWQNILKKDFTSFGKGRDVLPLLSITWNQNWPYNELCPAGAGSGGHVYAGCVATAMGQVMKYHNHPSPGVSLHSYIHPTYGSLSADFSTTYYDWMNMPDNISSSNIPIATLLYHSGVAVEMNYSPSGSGASTVFAIIALRTYFNYDTSSQLVYKVDYSVLDWENVLTTELDNSRPMLYAGTNPSSGAGHAFVCDGYQSTNYFHFNWGWSGYYDGYYYLNSLNPGTHDYTNDQQAIIGLVPNTSSYVYPLYSGFEYTKYDWTIIDNDGDGNKWRRWSYPHTGAKCIGVHVNPSGSDDWLISRQLGLSDNSAISFSFWARSWYSAEPQDFNVKLSTTGNNISDFTTTLESVNNAPVAWTEYSYDLSSYAGQNIYLAVQCVSTNDSYLMADDFAVTVNCYPVADAGIDTTANMGSLVTLDGSDSYDQYGGSINYNWSAPAGITLSDSTIVNPTFTTPTVSDSTDYAFTLIVDDGLIYSDPDTVVVTVIPFGIDDDILYPLATQISENYPNPFNQATTIKYALKVNSEISIEIYNIKGQKIRTLIDSKMQSGPHSIFWDGKDEKGQAVPSGIYFSKIFIKGESSAGGATENYNKVRKMVLLR